MLRLEQSAKPESFNVIGTAHFSIVIQKKPSTNLDFEQTYMHALCNDVSIAEIGFLLCFNIQPIFAWNTAGL